MNYTRKKTKAEKRKTKERDNQKIRITNRRIQGGDKWFSKYKKYITN